MFSSMNRYAVGMFVAGTIAVLALADGRAQSAVKCDPDNGGLRLPAGFCARVVADNNPSARHLVVAPKPLYRAVQGSNFGWPYCYFDYPQKKLLLNPEYGGDGKTEGRCTMFTPPVASFPAHWAPVDLMFYTGTQFPQKYRGGAFIAFHGSWNRAPEQAGYNVTFQPIAGGKASGSVEVFADGFTGKAAPVKAPGEAAARPDGIAQGPDGSLYVSEDVKGKMWRVFYRGGR